MGREPTDSKLLSRAAAGDADAFGDLYERHAKAIYNHCFRRTASWSVAEDVSSAVFLQAWRRRFDVRLHQGSALPWLLGIAANLARNQQRAVRRYQAALTRLPTPSDEDDFVDDLAGRLDDERAVRKVLEVVDRLPRREREVLALCAWDGLSYAGAAVALGVPVGTVRSRLSRARRRLERLLGGSDLVSGRLEGEMGAQHDG